MKSWLAPLRRPIERVPLVADTYRLLRDYLAFRTASPHELPQGFKLMGHPKMTTGHYELEETAVIEAALADADAFIDVGANIGYYSCLARSRGVPVVAFEPSATALRFLYANLLANELRDVEVLPVGISDHVELAVLYGTGGTASLVPGWSRASRDYAAVIPTTTLDRVLAGRFIDDKLLIKIDIEGAEHAMLAGATQTMARAIAPTWFVEIYLTTDRAYTNPNFARTFELFWEHGYTAREAVRGSAEIRRADVAGWVAAGHAPSQGANYLFTRPPR